MRVAADPNIIVSGLLSPSGAPAKILASWLEGEFELVVSPALLEELERVLDYPKTHRHVTKEDAAKVLQLLRAGDPRAREPEMAPSVTSQDPGDDYLIALAQSRQALLVSGDDDLLALKGRIPVYTAREFLDLLRKLPLNLPPPPRRI